MFNAKSFRFTPSSGLKLINGGNSLITSRGQSQCSSRRGCHHSSNAYQNIKASTVSNGQVGLVQLNRPRVLNALSHDLIDEMMDALHRFDRDKTIAAIVLTGSEEKVFTAGADINGLAKETFSSAFQGNFPPKWSLLSQVSKPIIAAVNGIAYGGGTEFSLMCDIIYAADNVRFCLPESRIGTCPGAGGSQRLPRAVGKSLAMEAILTGEPISAQDALRLGMVSRLFPPAEVLGEAIKLATRIAANSKLTVAIAKSAVNSAYETTLSQGMATEKQLILSTFLTRDLREGMQAFVEKRKPNFTDS